MVKCSNSITYSSKLATETLTVATYSTHTIVPTVFIVALYLQPVLIVPTVLVTIIIVIIIIFYSTCIFKIFVTHDDLVHSEDSDSLL